MILLQLVMLTITGELLTRVLLVLLLPLDTILTGDNVLAMVDGLVGSLYFFLGWLRCGAKLGCTYSVW